MAIGEVGLLASQEIVYDEQLVSTAFDETKLVNVALHALQVAIMVKPGHVEYPVKFPTIV